MVKERLVKTTIFAIHVLMSLGHAGEHDSSSLRKGFVTINI